jgi:methylmalonyl-CoA/ethylmalonyl-CoA epimerase
MKPASLNSDRIVQIGLIVPHIEDAIQAWSLLLGVAAPEIVLTDPVDQAHTEYRGQSTPARAKLAFFQLGQVTLELIEPVGEPSTWHDQLVAQGASLHHIAFEIEGMAEQLAILAEHGLPLLQRGDYVGGRYAYVDGTQRFGTVVELLEND